MITQHLRSPCCHSFIQKHGERRRLCAQCKKTWSVYPHKKGRKPRRQNYQLIKRIILDRQTVAEQTHYYPNLTKEAIKKCFQKSLRQLASQPRIYPKFQGKYILIGDAVWKLFNQQRWTLYLLLLKPRRRNYAYLLDPVLKQGKESMYHWQEVLEGLSDNIASNLLAVVSDNLPGLRTLVRKQELLHQLCQFHLIKEFQRRRGKRQAKTLATHPIREQVYQLVRYLLVAPESYQYWQKQNQLWQLAHHSPECPQKVGMLAREFLRNLALYRTYLEYPSYTIPRTTGAAESLAKMLKTRAHQINTPTAFYQWATVFMRLKGTMACNGTKLLKIPQN